MGYKRGERDIGVHRYTQGTSSKGWGNEKGNGICCRLGTAPPSNSLY